MMNARFYELNHHIPKLQLLEIFPLAPFLCDRQDMVTFDVGANMGLWSEAFLKMYGPAIRSHHMFEPLSGNLERLGKRRQNILSRMVGDLHVHPVAVGPEAGEVALNFDTEHSTLASVQNTKSVIGANTIALSQSRKVSQIALDDEIERQGIDFVDFLKIDVEGYEMSVLKGASRALAEGRIGVVLFEFGAHQGGEGGSFKDFHALLSGHGYHVYKAMRGTNFFGFGSARTYDASMEPGEKLVEMVLASRLEPSPKYKGPHVLGARWRANPDVVHPARAMLFKLRNQIARK